MQHVNTMRNGHHRAFCPERCVSGFLLVIIGVMLSAPGPVFADGAAIWKALRSGGHIALLRHAIAPGTGDPPDFTLGDCATQRNLSDEGRRQARTIGKRFRQQGIASARVYASQWCRCRETADLLALGPVQELPALNSFFGRYDRETPQTRQLKAWLSEQNQAAPLVLVTHQVNITALTGVYPASGEIVVVRHDGSGDFPVVGTIKTVARQEDRQSEE